MTMTQFKRFCIGISGVCLAILAGCSESAGTQGAAIPETLIAASGNPGPQFLHLSDIHFDPTADGVGDQLAAQPVEQWQAILEGVANQQLSNNTNGRTDSNYFLMKSALDQAKLQGPYDFIVYTGDYLPHRFSQGLPSGVVTPGQIELFKAKTVAFINAQIAARFGKTPVIAALGNNDAAGGDYDLQPGEPFLAAVAAQLPVIANDPAATASFKQSGSYLASPAGQPFDFLVLSVFWSASYPDQTRNCSSGGGSTAGKAQLNFLESALKGRSASSRPLLLVMHIPPGMDGYNSQRHGDPYHEWCEALDYDGEFQRITAQYRGVLSLGFAGHTHMDEFRVLSSSGQPYLGLRVGPSVTTWNGNNPGFTAMSYDPTSGAISDYRVYWLTNVAAGITPKQAIWQREYAFTAAYGAGGYTPAKLQQIAAAFEAGNGPERTAFTQYFKVSQPMPSGWRYYACATNQFDDSGYASCAARQ